MATVPATGINGDGASNGGSNGQKRRQQQWQ
jgi:hypothetical protein